jgi:alanyl-tRNA synthetase
VPAIAQAATRVGKVLLVAENIGSLGSTDDLRSLATSVRERIGVEASVVALAATVDHKPSVIVATNEAARKLGANAGTLAKLAADILGGGGGGKDDLAQGGGSKTAAIPAALDAIRESLV